MEFKSSHSGRFLQVVAVVTGQTLLTHWLIDSGTVLDFSF